MGKIDKHTKVLMHFNGNLKDECGTFNESDWVNGSTAGYIAGKFGDALSSYSGGSWIGLNIYANTVIQNVLSGDFTIELFKSAGVGLNILDRGDFVAANVTNYRLIIHESHFRVNGIDYYLDESNNVSKGTFVHVALTRKGNIYRLFVDGKKISENNIPSSGTNLVAVHLCGDAFPSAHTVDGCIDELRISDIARWTTDFTPPKLEYGKNFPLYLDSSNNVWGIDSTATFKQLATNWSSKSDSDKLALIKALEDIPTISDLSTIGKFKVIAMQDSTPITNTTVTAIPKTQTVYPTKLIKTSPFEKLNSVSITATSSGTGDIKIAVTTDLSTYKVWDKVTLAWIDIPKSDIATRGMSVSDVSALTDTEWNMLVSYGVGDGIAFAYSLDITADTDIAEIDELTLNAEMRGSWNKAFHGTDYIYGYPFYDQLSVKLLTDGSYKINYHD